jgi:hypothetical protein
MPPVSANPSSRPSSVYICGSHCFDHQTTTCLSSSFESTPGDTIPTMTSAANFIATGLYLYLGLQLDFEGYFIAELNLV